MDDGVVAISKSDGDQIIWSDGEADYVDKPAGTSEINVVAIEDGVVVLEDSAGRVHVWEDGSVERINKTGELVAIDDGVVAISCTDGSIAVWSHGETDIIDKPASSSIELVGMDNGLLAIELSNGNIKIWKDGAESYIEENPSISSTVVGMDDGIIVMQGDDGSVYIWEDGSTDHITSASADFFNVLSVNNGMVVLQDNNGDAYIWEDGSSSKLDVNSYYDVMGASNGVVAMQGYTDYGLALSYIWYNGELTTIGSAENTEIIDIDNGVVAIQGENRSYIWYNGEKYIIDQSAVYDVDGDYVYVRLDNSSEDYVWHHGMLTEITCVDLSYPIGAIGDEMYFVVDGTIIAIHADGSKDVVIDGFDEINSAEIAVDGQIYFVGTDGSSESRYSFSPGHEYSMVSENYFSSVTVAGSSFLLGDSSHTESLEYNYNGSNETLISITSPVDWIEYGRWDRAYADTIFEEYGPLVDDVTGSVVWNMLYGGNSFDEVGLNRWLHRDPYSYGKDVYVTSGDETYNLTREYATSITDTQNFAFATNRGITVTGGFTRESVSVTQVEGGMLYYTDFPPDNAYEGLPPTDFYYFKRVENSEIIWYSDGSHEEPIFTDIAFESLDNSDFQGWVENEYPYSSGIQHPSTLRLLTYYDIGPLYYDLLDNNAYLYAGVPEGESDLEYYMVWLTETQSISGDDEQDGPVSVPEPVSILLLLLGLAGMKLHKRTIR